MQPPSMCATQTVLAVLLAVPAALGQCTMPALPALTASGDCPAEGEDLANAADCTVLCLVSRPARACRSRDRTLMCASFRRRPEMGKRQPALTSTAARLRALSSPQCRPWSAHVRSCLMTQANALEAWARAGGTAGGTAGGQCVETGAVVAAVH